MEPNNWKSFGLTLSKANYVTHFLDEKDDDVRNAKSKQKYKTACGHSAEVSWRFCPHCGRLICPSPAEYYR